MAVGSAPHPVWLLIVALSFALLPVVVGTMTSYLKVSIVLGMIRSALGTQQLPNGLVVMVLSVALTLIIMSPCLEMTLLAAENVEWQEITQNPSLPNLRRLAPLGAPWRGFIEQHVGERELTFFARIAAGREGGVVDGAVTPAEADFGVLLAAFALGELKEAFVMGFTLLVPFLVVDLIIANLLVGMGMFMLSPVMVSLPVKLILFVLADGWMLIARGLISSYGTAGL